MTHDVQSMQDRGKPFGWGREKLPRAIRKPHPAPYRMLAGISLVLIAGVLLGIGSAYMIIEREEPLDSISAAPWKAFPRAGTPQADPYSVAIYTRGGNVPLASGEGLALVARQDSSGRILDPTCDYRITGRTPPARLWTLTAVDGRGRLAQTLPGRAHLVSDNLLRLPDGSFQIAASKRARSGNWLPLAKDAQAIDGLRLVLRLYDAPVTTGSALDTLGVPAIERTGCS